jgi:uncharacterized protein YdaT
MHVPKEISDVAEFLVEEGYSRAEAYPIERWRARGWSEQPAFFEAVDACIKLTMALERLS